MKIKDLLAQAALQLEKAGVDDASIDARLLFQHLAKMTRAQLILHEDQIVDPQLGDRFKRLVDRRSRRIPLQYLTGFQEFWSLDFIVSPSVLIPRPETEFLLEQVLATCAASGRVNKALDMCTGSGIIAVVLEKELACPVVAVDISEPALAVAAENLRRHHASDRVLLVCSDLFTAIAPNQKFDLIVSNPPYIVDDQLDALEPEVKDAEPRLALSGGVTGLRIIEQLASTAEHFLRPGGWIFLEIGADQKDDVIALFTALERAYDDVEVLDDLAGRPRVLQARYAPRMEKRERIFSPSTLTHS